MASLQIGVFLFALSCSVLHVKAFQISNMDNVHISDHELALQKHQADVEKLMRMNQLHQQQQQYQPQHQHTQQQQIYQRALTQNSTFNQIYQIDTKALAKPEKGCVDEVKKVTETVHDDVILCNLSYETQCSMIDTTKFEAVSSEECTNESTACNIDYSQDPPQEECVLTEKVCTTTTKMVPRTEQAEDCVDVPKEVCTRSNANPQEITKEVVKRTCYNPENVAPAVPTIPAKSCANPKLLESSMITCTASSEYSGDYVCQKAFDGPGKMPCEDDWKNGWATKGEGVGAWIKAEFVEVIAIKKLRIKQRIGSWEQNSGIEIAFDGGVKKDFKLDVKGCKSWNIINLSEPVATRTMKIRISSVYGTDNNGFKEIEIYGCI